MPQANLQTGYAYYAGKHAEATQAQPFWSAQQRNNRNSLNFETHQNGSSATKEHVCKPNFIQGRQKT